MTINTSIQALRNRYLTGEASIRETILALHDKALASSEYNAWITLLSPAELEPYLLTLEQEDPESLPLYGIPFAIKDNIDLAGIPTTAGCKEFTYTPEHSSFVVEQLIAAGAIPLGKTNLDQFATGLVGVRSPWGEGKNVFNMDYVSGGSSAGSAISTALGLVSFALGTDTAGSGRVPAAFNNLVGMKPSRGLLSNTGVVPACKSLDCISIFALAPEDAATVFEVAAQFDSEDCYSQARHWANRAAQYTEKPSEFTFGVPDQLEFHGDMECEALFKESIKALEALGGTAVTIAFEPFINAAKLLYEGPWVAERQWATRNVNRDHMLPVIRKIIEGADSQTAEQAFAAFYRLQAYKGHADDVMASVDFILTPTTPTAFTREEVRKKPIERNSILGTYTNFVNLLDYAATAVPTGSLKSGVHWGVTLVGPRDSDIRLLSFAGRLQKHCMKHAGALDFPLLPYQNEAKPTPTDFIEVVVCGAHLSGMPLNWQLTDRGGVCLEKTKTSKSYRLYALSDGKRPALVKSEEGAAIDVEIWSLPAESFGSFVADIPAPLGIGKTELEDGRFVTGFICEHGGLNDAKDITEYGGWRNWLAK